MKMRPGALLGDRYRLEHRIATGGVGEVWKALDEPSDRPVAVKVLRDRHLGDQGFRERFRAEAHHTAALAHPGIAEVFDFVEHGALAYLVMEYLPGRPLSALLRGGRELGPRLTLGIIGQIAVTLQAAHEGGVVHRDIKPDNLIVGDDGRVKVTDFGIARAADMATLTQPGVVLGTAVYMSPEQAEAQRVTAATDIYSLGVVCYECLAGRVPFAGSTPVEIAFGHVREQPPALPPYVPRTLRDLVAQCLAKDPADRPTSMARIAEIAYSIAQTLKPAQAMAVSQALEPTAAQHIAGRGRHRGAPRRHRPAIARPPKPGGSRSVRGTARPPTAPMPAATGGGVGRLLRPRSANRRRAVLASLAGTTVLASGLVFGARIGVFPATTPFRDAETSASPAPTATARAQDPMPGRSGAPLLSESPATFRGMQRPATPSTPGTPGTPDTRSTPGSTPSSPSATTTFQSPYPTHSDRPSPTRHFAGNTTPAPSSTGESSPGPYGSPTPSPSVTATADDYENHREQDRTEDPGSGDSGGSPSPSLLATSPPNSSPTASPDDDTADGGEGRPSGELDMSDLVEVALDHG